jgi:plasmid maintenance system antidote protein VapI
MKTWDQRIKELEVAGWSISAIAEAIGISPSAVSDIKNRRTRAPTGYAAVRLVDLAGKKPDLAKRGAA